MPHTTKRTTNARISRLTISFPNRDCLIVTYTEHGRKIEAGTANPADAKPLSRMMTSVGDFCEINYHAGDTNLDTLFTRIEMVAKTCASMGEFAVTATRWNKNNPLPVLVG